MPYSFLKQGCDNVLRSKQFVERFESIRHTDAGDALCCLQNDEEESQWWKTGEKPRRSLIKCQRIDAVPLLCDTIHDFR